MIIFFISLPSNIRGNQVLVIGGFSKHDDGSEKGTAKNRRSTGA